MNLINLNKIVSKGNKRVGRGIGSGKGGHTSSRGAKGQKARGKVPQIFEGTKIKKSLIKRLPLLRGKGKFSPSKKKPFVLNLKYLSLFSANDEVTLDTLEKRGIIKKESALYGVKILGDGEVNVALIVKLPVSSGARVKIEKAGGRIDLGGPKSSVDKKSK